MSRGYIVRSKKVTDNNSSRCWMNIAVSKLEEASRAKVEYLFNFFIEGTSYKYSCQAQDLQNAFKNYGISVKKNKNSKCWNFYVEYISGKVFSSVSASNTASIFGLSSRKTDACNDAVQTETTSVEYGEVDSLADDETFVDEQCGCPHLQELGIGKSPVDPHNRKAIETYNYSLASRILADYGFECMRVNNDKHGADFIAYNANTCQCLKIQLKGVGVHIAKKYQGKDLYMLSKSTDGKWYMVPHDILLQLVPKSYLESGTWNNRGFYYSKNMTKELVKKLARYCL